MVYKLEEDPTNLQEIVFLECWLMVVAVNDESDSLESNKTWFLVDLLHDCQINGCKWFLEKKKL
jgi:hypothetical protein